jgi:membrane fusion protein (multidrug efflux system)
VRLLGNDGEPLGANGTNGTKGTGGITGKLNFTGNSVDTRLGTVGLRAAFANPDMAVLPGQFVKAQVQVGQQKAWLVPQAAVFTGEQGKIVWTVQGGKAVPTPVVVGGWVGTDWAVLKGLKDGDQVITDNLLKLRPGAAVQPNAAASASAGSMAASATASAPASAVQR